MTSSLGVPSIGWQAGLLVLCAAVGGLAAINPVLALAATIALIFVAIAMINITAGLCLFVFVSFLDVLRGGASSLGFTKIAGLVLVLSWLAVIATHEDAHNDFVSEHPLATYALALFLGWSVLGLVWAENGPAVITFSFRYIQNAFLFLIVYTAIQTRKHVVWLISAFVIGATVAALVALANPPTASELDTTRASGTIGDPNELAAVLVAGLILAGSLAATLKGSAIARLAAISAAILCAGGIAVTLSRGGLIALGFALIAALFVSGRWRGRAMVVAIAISLVTVTYFATFASLQARERVTTVQGGTGRSDLWTVGWRMVEAHPVRGVGSGNFPTQSVHYLFEPGAIKRDEFIISKPKVAHNTYLQVLAELGIVGLTLFVGILIFSIASAIKAARRFMAARDTQMEILSRGVVVALMGTLAADVFISAQFSKPLWLLLGLGPALLAISTRATKDRAPSSLGASL